MPTWQICIVFPRGLDHAATLAYGVADGLLDIYMFAGLHGPNRHQSMPVVWSRRGYDIDRLVVECLAQILHIFRFSALDLGNFFGPFLPHCLVRVNDISHFRIFSVGISL